MYTAMHTAHSVSTIFAKVSQIEAGFYTRFIPACLYGDAVCMLHSVLQSGDALFAGARAMAGICAAWCRAAPCKNPCLARQMSLQAANRCYRLFAGTRATVDICAA